MNSNRTTAVVAGVLFIIATLASLVSTAFLSPILGAPDHLTRIAADMDQVLAGAFFQFIGAVACPAIAIALYPVLRRSNEGLALGSVAFRIIEGALYVAIVVILLVLVTLSQAFVDAHAPASSAYQTAGLLLLAARDELGPVAGVMTFSLGALMYYWVFYKAHLIPRWLSAWGLVGATCCLLAGVLVLFHVAEPMSAPQVVLSLPIAVQEMVLAVWLIAKGFDPSAIATMATDRAPLRLAVATAPMG